MQFIFTISECALLVRFCLDNLEGLKEAKEAIIEDRATITSADDLLTCMASVEEEWLLTESIMRKVEQYDHARRAGDASPVPPRG